MRIINTKTMVHRIYIVLVFINFVRASSLYPSPVSSHSATVVDDHQTQKKDDIYNKDTKEGIASTQTSSGFNKESEKKTVIGQDRGNYNQENVSKNQHEDSGQRQGQNFHHMNTDSVNKIGKKGGHRKGHHKSGYQNSYHKDESENNSSFYDDSDDQGGHFIYDSRAGAAGQSEADRFHGAYDNGRLNNVQNAQRGQYDVGGRYGNERDDRRAYDQHQYYNDRRDKANSNIGNVHGEVGRNFQERNYQQHPYYQQHLPPLNHQLPPLNHQLPPLNHQLPPFNHQLPPLQPINQPIVPLNPPINQPLLPIRDQLPPVRDPLSPVRDSLPPVRGTLTPIRGESIPSVQSKKTITIYEDPRVFDLGYSHPIRRFPQYEPRYDSDLVHLDFRRSPLQYNNNRRQYYDYYQ